MALAALLLVATFGAAGLPSTRHEVRAEGTFVSLIRARQRMVAGYFATLKRDIRTQSTGQRVAEAIDVLSAARQALGTAANERLQRAYGASGPREPDWDSIDYARLHAKYHPEFIRYLRVHGYADALLFDSAGNVVYSVRKGLDFATNVLIGRWKDTDLGTAFRAARNTPRAGFQAFFNFKTYPPDGGAPTATMASPVLDADGAFVGALAVLIPVESMNDTMVDIAGRTFMVGRCAETTPLSVCAWRP